MLPLNFTLRNSTKSITLHQENVSMHATNTSHVDVLPLNFTLKEAKSTLQHENISMHTTNTSHVDVLPAIPFNATHLPKLAFLHIGKTAGTTLSFQINGACMNPRVCRKHRPHVVNESLPAQAMTNYFHIYQVERMFSPTHFDGYIVPVRNPIHRIISAYLMYHIENNPSRNNEDVWKLQKKFYKQCFPQANVLAEQGLDESQLSNNKTLPVKLNGWLRLPCKTFGHAVVEGKCPLKLFWHFYYNYQRYCAKMLHHVRQHSNKLVLVVRQEYLWKDWNNLHILLGGGSDVPKTRQDTTKTNHVHDSHAFKQHNTTVSTQGYHNLCRVLRNEIQVYLEILQRATNLNESDVKEAVDNMQVLCGDSLNVTDLLPYDDMIDGKRES